MARPVKLYKFIFCFNGLLVSRPTFAYYPGARQMAPVTSFAARGSATAPAPQSLCREALAGAACRRGLATGPTNNDARTAVANKQRMGG